MVLDVGARLFIGSRGTSRPINPSRKRSVRIELTTNSGLALSPGRRDYVLSSGFSCRAAFHMFELLFAQRFALGLLLTKISARGRLSRPRGLRCLARTPTWKEATEESHQGHAS